MSLTMNPRRCRAIAGRSRTFACGRAYVRTLPHGTRRSPLSPAAHQVRLLPCLLGDVVKGRCGTDRAGEHIWVLEFHARPPRPMLFLVQRRGSTRRETWGEGPKQLTYPLAGFLKQKSLCDGPSLAMTTPARSPESISRSPFIEQETCLVCLKAPRQAEFKLLRSLEVQRVVARCWLKSTRCLLMWCPATIVPWANGLRGSTPRAERSVRLSAVRSIPGRFPRLRLILR